jgi:hypothetical protein
MFNLLFLFFHGIRQSQILKFEEIMKGDAFIGVQPTNGRWSLTKKPILNESQ